MDAASYPWVLDLKRPLTQSVKWYSQESPWVASLHRWKEEIESFNSHGDRWFVTVAKAPTDLRRGEEALDFLLWHILPRVELRDQLPGVLSAPAAIYLLDLDAEQSVVLTSLS